MDKKPPRGLRLVKDKAEAIAKDSGKTADLVEKAFRKAERNRSAVQKFKDDILVLLRLLKAWGKGEYKHIPWSSVVMGVAAILYFVNPFDLIPDFISGVGFLDDATVIAFVLQTIKRDLIDFNKWEEKTKP